MLPPAGWVKWRRTGEFRSSHRVEVMSKSSINLMSKTAPPWSATRGDSMV